MKFSQSNKLFFFLHAYMSIFFQLTLNLLTSISKTHKSCMASLHNEILPQILQLIQSPLLQGGALTALLELFQALVLTGLPKHGFRDFLQVLVVETITAESIMFLGAQFLNKSHYPSPMNQHS